MGNKKAMDALMSIEGFRSLNQDIQTIINKSEKVKEAKKLLRQKRVNFIAPADYRKDGRTYQVVCAIIDKIKADFRDKTIMVTGAAGSIGSELCRQLATFGIKQLVMFDNAETPMHNVRLEFEERFPDLKFVPVIGDVRQPQRLDFAFRKYRPQVVFHAAAYKHVPLMETSPAEAVKNNVFGTFKMAKTAAKFMQKA